MKIFITGATGYVGSHLIKELSKSEHEIFALARTGSDTKKLASYNVKWIEGDITKNKSFESIPNQFEVIIHLAFSLFPEPNPLINVAGFNNILSFAQQNPIKKFIYVSSQLVYGNTTENEIIDESFPCNPSMVFAKQQLLAENQLNNLYKNKNFPSVILRPSEIYGGQGGFFKNVQLDGYINGKVPIIGNGKNAISFTYIGDLVEVIIHSIEKPRVEGNVFNINSPGKITQNELIQFIKSKTKTKPVFKIPMFIGWIVASFAKFFAKIRNRVPFMDYDVVKVATMKSGERSIEKAKKMLDFSPKYPDIKTGLTDCYF